MQKISNEELSCMRIFYSETGVEPSDCLLTAEGMAFLVPPGMVGRAVGKKGINVHKLLIGHIGAYAYLVVFESDFS